VTVTHHAQGDATANNAHSTSWLRRRARIRNKGVASSQSAALLNAHAQRGIETLSHARCATHCARASCFGISTWRITPRGALHARCRSLRRHHHKLVNITSRIHWRQLIKSIAPKWQQ